MKYFSLFILFFCGLSQAETLSDLERKVWIHGAENCDDDRDPAIDVYEFSSNTHILRQNKCLSFEAPFIYVLVGKETTLLIDTGALSGKEGEGIVEFIEELPKPNNGDHRNLLVAHTHSHNDHTAGDSLFRNKEYASLIEPKLSAIIDHFEFRNWPKEIAEIDLGERKLSIIPIPGHQEESIAIYDHQTKWLLTGDTLYPGRIYVKDWKEYKNSIRRLVEFSNSHQISAILGSHIEMSNEPFIEFRIGSTYQPNEASLILKRGDLIDLNRKLSEQKKAGTIKFSKFTIQPLSWFQKTLGAIVKFFSGSK